VSTPPAASPLPRRSRFDEDAETVPWVANGLVAGLLGASVVALFFLAVDALAGRPLWTPSVLAAALFRGEPPRAAASPDPLMVLAFTGVHVTVFVALALPAAFWALAHLPTSEGRGRAVLLAVGLFAAFELFFFAMTWLFSPGLVDALRASRITAANALAAAAVAAFIFARARSEPSAADRPAGGER
jgi:hypothetical protein